MTGVGLLKNDPPRRTRRGEWGQHGSSPCAAGRGETVSAASSSGSSARPPSRMPNTRGLVPSLVDPSRNLARERSRSAPVLPRIIPFPSGSNLPNEGLKSRVALVDPFCQDVTQSRTRVTDQRDTPARGLMATAGTHSRAFRTRNPSPGEPGTGCFFGTPKKMPGPLSAPALASAPIVACDTGSYLKPSRSSKDDPDARASEFRGKTTR